MSGTHPTALAAQIVAVTAAILAVALDHMAVGPTYTPDPAIPNLQESTGLLLFRPNQELTLRLLVMSFAALTIFVTAAVFAHTAPQDPPSGLKWVGCLALVPGVALIIGVVDVFVVTGAIADLAWQAAVGTAFLVTTAFAHSQSTNPHVRGERSVF